MGKFWTSASSLERISRCPASAALPQTRNVSEASEKGTGDHDAMEQACLPGVEVVTLPSGKKVRVSELHYPQWPRSEIAFSYDVVSGEAMDHGRLPGHRAYPDSPYSTLFGTADVVGSMEVEIDGERQKVAFVDDTKTGHPNFLPESDSWQMRFLALAATKVMGLRYAITRITSVRDDNCGFDGFVQVVHKPKKVWRPAELDETEALLRRMYDAVNKHGRKGVGIGDVVHGYHCAFCPALPSCPYMLQILSGGRLSALDTRNMAQAYHNLQALKTATKRLEEAVKSAAPISLGEGYVYGKTSSGHRRYKLREETE